MSKLGKFIKDRTSTLFPSEGSFAYAESYDGMGVAAEPEAAQPSDKRKTAARQAAGSAQIVVLDHIGREDATRIADYIGGSRMVVMDLADTPREDRLRILDFLSGYMYSEQGKISRINSHAYIAVPGHVDLYGAAEEDESLFAQLANAFGGQTAQDTGGSPT